MGSTSNGSIRSGKMGVDPGHTTSSSAPSMDNLDFESVLNAAMPFDDPIANQAFYGPMEHTDRRDHALHIPESPAPQGYLANPYRQVAIDAHAILNDRLAYVTEAHWQSEYSSSAS